MIRSDDLSICHLKRLKGREEYPPAPLGVRTLYLFNKQESSISSFYVFYECFYIIKIVIVTIYTISVINNPIFLIPFKAV